MFIREISGIYRRGAEITETLFQHCQEHDVLVGHLVSLNIYGPYLGLRLQSNLLGFARKEEQYGQGSKKNAFHFSTIYLLFLQK